MQETDTISQEKQHLLVFMCFSVTECHGEVFGDKK